MGEYSTRSGRSVSRTGACLLLSFGVVVSVTGFSFLPMPVEYFPEILSSGIRPHSRLAFSPDGQEVYWSGYVIGEGTTEKMFFSVRQDQSWTVPALLPVNGGLGNGPTLSPDGSMVFFGAQRRLQIGGPVYSGIWFAERSGAGWGDVQPVTTTLDSTGFAGRPCFAKNGTLYFLARGTRSEVPAVFRCVPENGRYAEPELVMGDFDGEIVMDPWIDPDERFLLLMRDDWAGSWPSFGSSDLYISYRRADDTWSEPKNLGSAINTGHFDRSPSMSSDGRYLFFIRAIGDVFVESDAHFFRVKVPKHEAHPVSASDLAHGGGLLGVLEGLGKDRGNPNRDS